MNQQRFNAELLLDYWRMVRRRKWFILITLCVSLLLAWGLIFILPKSYRSSTLILVEGQKIPERYVQGVVSGSVQERLSLIQQQVMSRTLLSAVAEEFHLYRTKDSKEIETVIDKMRQDIRVETKGGGRVESFTISYAHEDPVIAMKVTSKLASAFIEENLKIREQFVEGASEFLDQELSAASLALQSKEKEIGQFKQKYMGELPGQIEANLRALDRIQAELASVEEMLPKLSERLDAMDKAIANYDMSWASISAPSSSRSSVMVPSMTIEDPQRVKLRDLEQKLAVLTAQFKDTYPDVIQLRQEIERTKARITDSQPVKDNSEEKHQGSDRLPTGQPGEAAVPSISSDPYLQGLVKQRSDLKVELMTLKERQRRLHAQIKDYEGRVERTPMREQELTILMRDYENMQRNYQSLLDKKLNARIAENLEKRQKGEQFRILDPAHLPSKPEKPDPLKIMLAGLVVGCGVGFGGAVLLEQSAQAFTRVEQVESQLKLPVLATIPEFRQAYEVHGVIAAVPSSSGEMMGDSARAKASRRSSAKGYVGQPSGTKKKLLSIRKEELHYPLVGKQDTALETMKYELNLVSRWRPASLVAEQFRVAATRLILAAGSQKSSVVVVSSALQGEGKSATASNLAYVLAEDLGKKVVIVDCDFKRPVIHLYTGVSSKPGLVEAIYNEQPLDDCLQHCGGGTLKVLPISPDPDRPVGLTNMPQIHRILDDLRQSFDFIIVDAPPIMPLADMNLLAGMADILVVVVRAGITTQEMVRKAIKALKPVVQTGVILTGYAEENLLQYLRQYYTTPQN